jgi:NAD(P)H-nitrite reductase large subunit
MEGRAMEEKKCTGDHAQHLCKLEEEGRFEEIKQLVKDPKYICAICKRAADSEYNLCSPVDVDASRYM